MNIYSWERHFLKMRYEKAWREVTKDEFIRAERNAGFRPKLNSDHPHYDTAYATAGFSGNGVEGKVEGMFRKVKKG